MAISKRSAASVPKNQLPKKKYTMSEIKSAEKLRKDRYNDLLNCARDRNMTIPLILPTADNHGTPMAKVCLTLKKKVELLDIYDYLLLRRKDIKQKVSLKNFGNLIGYDIPKSSFHDIVKKKDELRAQAPLYPEGACYIVQRKNLQLETVLLKWLEDQRTRLNPINKRMIQDAAKTTYVILAGLKDPEGDPSTSGMMPSFSVSWFNAFKKRHNITYCQLRGEAGSVDLEAIEPELVAIRSLCSQYTPDNIYNCDETGFYLKELDHKSYTTQVSEAGVKANKNCRVTILFCINASGTSLLKAESMDALKPLVIGKNIAQGIDIESGKKMIVRKSESGWMTNNIFVNWLKTFDDQLTEPSLLLLDSAPQHNNIDMRNPSTNEPWKHLRIQRLPVNSTSVTQPLDAGVISVFKRAFLEILTHESHLVRTFDMTKAISNGHAWSIIPSAWNSVKAMTLRNCFAKTPVLPEEMRKHIRAMSSTSAERCHEVQYTRSHLYKEQERAYFEHLIASVSKGNEWVLDRIAEKDVQDILEEEHGSCTSTDGNSHEIVNGNYEATPLSINSSPISKESFHNSIDLLTKLSNGHDISSPEGMEAIFENTKKTA